VPLQHIPYKSAGNALTAMLTGEVQVSFLSPLTAHAQLKAGKVKALAVSSATRFAGSPEIPGAAEAGIPGMDVRLWFGLFAPAKTPKSVVAKLNREIGEILRNPETQETFLKQGVAATPGTPEELGEWVKTELARWTPVIQATASRRTDEIQEARKKRPDGLCDRPGRGQRDHELRRTRRRGADRDVHRAIDLGVTLFDTADRYMKGRHERMLGRALKGRRDEVIVCSKFGNIDNADGTKAYNASPST